MGELLRLMPKNTGGRPSETPPPGGGVSGGPTLADLGVSTQQASRLQQLAGISDEDFEAEMAKAQDAPSTKEILRAARALCGPGKGGGWRPDGASASPTTMWSMCSTGDFGRGHHLQRDPWPRPGAAPRRGGTPRPPQGPESWRPEAKGWGSSRHPSLRLCGRFFPSAAHTGNRGI